MKKFSKKPTNTKKETVTSNGTVTSVTNKRVEGRELLTHLKTYEHVKIKGYTYSF